MAGQWARRTAQGLGSGTKQREGKRRQVFFPINSNFWKKARTLTGATAHYTAAHFMGRWKGEGSVL